ncbi:MAG: hypothetical protein GTO63_35010, partial [Anaerolineae bacterium]|nr:hypothetical protein [Anaerolineae bacterium]NIN99904.1 hypothetical protein [Anaerolineae bacterium]NIQ82674.1 hypothetical protein [Anaerolineae bacterium]
MSSTHTSTVKTNARPLGAFTSDWHMKPYTWMAYPELRGDSYRSAGFISQFCVERELDLYVLGDTLDKRDPDSRTVYELLKIIAAQQRVD